MRRSIVRLACFVPLLAAVPAAADCIIAPGLPGFGIAISCDGSPPNPWPSSVDGTPEGDSISLGDGFALVPPPPGLPAVELFAGDDELLIGDGVVLPGPVDGGDGVDELIFLHTLSPAACAAAIAELAAADPAAGSITLGGLLYEWSDFETLTPAFDCLTLTEVPALSWHGLLALGLLLGVLGVGVLRLRG